MSDFDAYIHSDLCEGGPAPSGDGAFPGAMGFMPPPFSLTPGVPPSEKSPFHKSSTPEEMPALSFDWSSTSASSSASAPAIGGAPEALRPPPPGAPGGSGALRVPSPAEPGSVAYPFGLLSAQQSPGKPVPGGDVSVAPSSAMMPLSPVVVVKQEPEEPPQPTFQPAPAPAPDEPDVKRPRVQSGSADLSASAPMLPQSVPPPAVSRSGSAPAARKGGNGRRPPPSASQITEAGNPFPVIDTSAKHSSLFIPPDTSGLTKREARLVKNRAAAFLSRQRKREQFEELGGKCKVLGQLAWRLWERLAHYAGGAAAEVAADVHTIERVLDAAQLQLPAGDADELRAALLQVVQQRGTMLLESILGDERPGGARPEDRSPPLVMQLDAARAECDALRAQLQERQATGSPAAASTTPAAPAAPVPPVALAKHLVGMAVTHGRAAPAAPLVSSLLDTAPGPVHLRVHDGDPVLCTVTDAEPETPERKPSRSSTPADASDASSVPSLASAGSPASSTPTSVSSGSSTPAGALRRVMAISTDALDASQLHGLRHVCLDAWAGKHLPPARVRAAGAELEPEALAQLAHALREAGADVRDGCLVCASLDVCTSDTPPAPAKLRDVPLEALRIRMSLHARPCSSDPGALDKALQAVRGALGALLPPGPPSGALEEHAWACTAEDARARDSLLHVTFRP